MTSRYRWGTGLTTAGLILLVILPVAYLALRVSGQPAQVLAVLGQSATLGIILRSLGLTAVVTILALIVSVPSAFLITRTNLPGRSIWQILLMLPLVVPSYVGAFAFIAAFGPEGSIVQQWLSAFGIARLPSIYGWPGAVIVLTLFTYPYCFLSVQSALQRMDPRLEDVSRGLGRGPWQTFWTVTVPRLAPAMGAGGLLVALYVLSDFGAVSLLQFDSFTRQIYIEYNFSFDRFSASLLSLILIVMTIGILLMETILRRRYGARPSAEKTGGASRPPHRLGKWTVPALGWLLLVVAGGVVVPVGTCLFWMVRAWSTQGMPPVAWSTVTNSVGISVAAATVCVVLSVPVAFFLRSQQGRWDWLERLVYLGYALPGIVVGLALVFIGAGWLPWIYQTLFLLVIAYTIRFIPQALSPVTNSLNDVHESYPEAARSLGSAPWSVFRRIWLPLMRPGLTAGAVLVFLTTIKELPATLMLRPTGFDTLAIQIWQATESAFFARAGTHGLILILVSGGLSLLLGRRLFSLERMETT